MLGKNTRIFLQGLPIGLANTLPGMSGGTVALILYLYEPLLKALKRIDLKFLLPLGLGAAAGALLGALVIERFIRIYPDLIMALLAGMILASLRVTLREAGGINLGGGFSKVKALKYGLLVLGILAALLLSGGSSGHSGSAGNFRIFLAGFFGSATMILPGVSGGTVLVIMGVYRPVISAIASLSLVPLFFFGSGLAVGLVVFAWFLSWLLQEHRQAVMYLLSGLILGSLGSVVPPAPGLSAVVLFLLGFLAVWLLISWAFRRESI